VTIWKHKTLVLREIGGGMAITCTRCDGSGFLNINQIPDEFIYAHQDNPDWPEIVKRWARENQPNDVTVCDCCGDGEDDWYGIPGEHYNQEDPRGHDGPYGYNGGLCECN
jgi:hypothetical protein